MSSPVNLSSPASASSSSSHQPAPFAMSSHPSRAPSAASGVSGASAFDAKSNHLGAGSPPDAEPSPIQSPVYSDSGSHTHPHHLQTPQPQAPPGPPGPLGAGPYAHVAPQSYLPPVTSSPPPHAPPYVPPPQHAMAPDPIHSVQMGMPPPGPGMMGSGGPWQNGPWRGPQPAPQPYRQGMPNGQPPGPGLQHQLPPNPSDPYPGGPRMSGTPGPGPLPQGSLLQHAIMGNGPRPPSAHGEGRERRRRDRDDERGDRERDGDDEVISTIFVVGFPDDMQEREFQNIFTFAPGFEAATLKFPSGAGRGREPTAALLAELTQIAANQQAAQAAAAENGEPFMTGALEDAIAALQMAGTASTSSSTTPSAAISLTPSAPSGPVLGGPPLPSVPTRRQTIGFARFKTRADALVAREHLQGRKIDPLTGASLKAEMAKKNLHTKRNTSGEEIVGMLIRSGRLNGLLGVGPQMQQQQAAAAAQGMGIGGGTLPGGPMMGPIGGVMPPPPQAGGGGLQVYPSAKEAWDSWPNHTAGGPVAPPMGVDRERQPSGEDLQSKPIPSAGYNGFYPPGPPSSSFPASGSSASSAPQPPASSQSNASGSPTLSVKSPAQRPTDSKALLALAEEADELEGWSVGGAVGMGFNAPGLDGYLRGSGSQQSRDGGQANSSGANSQQQRGGAGLAQGVGPGSGLAVGGGMYPMRGDMTYGTSPPGGSDQLSETGRGMSLNTVNPGDQNPPINTLYVGNLPAISPPTHPPNFLEESLRGLFQRCQGFKRMSFRQKINGPMCFVEFEDIPFAAHAIKDLYGHTLGGLVKGGIRLSYSKNSLGQRGNAHPAGINTSMFGGIAHTVALAGMSTTNPSGPTGATPPSGSTLSSNPYGLGLSQGSQPMQVPSSAPGSDRRSSEATTLSPTAQPFNAPLPLATSPRSRYFGGSVGAGPSSGPLSKESSSAGTSSFGGFTPSSSTPGVPSTAGTTNSSTAPGPGGFSPMSSPIRTPASFSWVSSGNGYGAMGGAMGGGMNLGGMGGGFDPFTGPVGSLTGAASAWGQSQGSNNGAGGGQ